MKNVGAVGKVSEAGYPAHGRQQESGGEHQERDTEGAQGKDIPETADSAGQQRYCPHEARVPLKPIEVEIDGGAYKEEGELAGKLNGEGMVSPGIQNHAVQKGQEKAATKRPCGAQAPAEPYQNGDEEVKHDFHFDRPKSSVYGGQVIVGKDSGQVGMQKGGESKIRGDVLPGGGGGDKAGQGYGGNGGAENQCIKQGQPIAGQDALGAAAEVAGGGARAVPAGHDEAAADGEEALDGHLRVNPTAQKGERRREAQVGGMDENDRPGEAKPEQIEVVLALHADDFIMRRYLLPSPESGAKSSDH